MGLGFRFRSVWRAQGSCFCLSKEEAASQPVQALGGFVGLGFLFRSVWRAQGSCFCLYTKPCFLSVPIINPNMEFI